MNKTRPDYNYLYKITCDVTPLPTDCGVLCSSICCRPNHRQKLGVYLFPGEEVTLLKTKPWYTLEYHDPQKYNFPNNWEDPVYFLKCHKPCPREARPLACRFFPLAPHLLQDGTLLLIYETTELPYKCPLITRKIEIQEQFIDTVAFAWESMIKDPLIHQLVKDDSKERENIFQSIPTVLWSSHR